MAVLDMTGERYGRLVVVEQREGTKHTTRWLCRCDCGKEKIVQRSNLRTGSVSSCGCLAREIASKRWTTHGASVKRTPEYISWAQMRQRCMDPKATGYARYGGAGVKVCERWNDFAAFLADMGPRPAGTSIDRYPNKSGNYEPGNCRWATDQEQNLNRRWTPEALAANRERGKATGRLGGLASVRSRRAARAAAITDPHL